MIFLAIHHFYAVGQGDAVANPAIELRFLHRGLALRYDTRGRKSIFPTTAEGGNAQHEES